MVLSAVNFLETVPAGEQIAAAIPNSEHALGGLWNPEGPTESATTHIISPATILSDHPEPRPSAVDNSAGLPPVGNQQTQGSCTAWAIGYYHATYIENREHPFDLTDPANQISPAFLYNVANGGYNGGSFMNDVADLLISNGACSMADMPYNTADYTSWPSEDWMWVSGMKHRAISQNWLDLTDPHGMDALKAHLAGGNTATTGIDVWGNFDNIESYNYTYCSSEITGSNRGGHIVAIIGYDDEMPTADGKGAFRMVNSWGTGWGEAGFWWMSYEAIVDGVLGYGQAMYLESMVDYAPKLVAKVSIYHDARGDIVRNSGLELSIYQNESTLISKPFLSCYWIEYWYGTGIQNHPFPEGKMAFDISEFIPYMDPLADCEFDLMLYNQGTATGDLATFEVLNSEWWEGCIGEGLPMTIEPSTDNYGVAFTVPETFVHYPIRADGDLGLAHRAIGEMWEGDGTPGNPYLIHDYIINGSDWGNCIYVGNTTADFEISGCQANYASSTEWSEYHGDSGIMLYNTTAGRVDGNTVSSNLIGLFLYHSQNTFVSGNAATANSYGMLISVCSILRVFQNEISLNTEYGILVETSTFCIIHHNNLVDNTVQAFDDTGTNMWDCGYSPESMVYGESVSWSPTETSEYHPLQEVWQDTYNHTTTQTWIQGFADAGYSFHFDAANLQALDVSISPASGTADLDLAIFFDGLNGCPEDGIPQWQEIITQKHMVFDAYGSALGTSNYCWCADSDASEAIKISNPWDGHYIVKVLGYAVTGEPGLFNLAVETERLTVGYLQNEAVVPGSLELTVMEQHFWTSYRYNHTSKNPVCTMGGTEIAPWGFLLPFVPNGSLVELSLYDDAMTPNDTSDDIWVAFSAIFTEGTDFTIDYLTGYVEILTFDGWPDGLIFANYTYYINTQVSSDDFTLDANSTQITFDPPVTEHCLMLLANYSFAVEIGGNYWSDYGGTDLFSGAAQDQPGSDRFGDTPYPIIDGMAGAVDRWPLMVPWGLPHPEIIAINLTTGWNLISIPLDMADTSIEGVLASISGSWDSVKYYTPLDASDPWKSYRSSGTANDLAVIDMTMGIWVHATANCTLSVQGEIRPTTQITLYAGWNLVGYPSQTEMAVADALWGTGADRVEIFDPASPTLIMPVGPGYIMRPGEGYWVHVSADTIWSIDW